MDLLIRLLHLMILPSGAGRARLGRTSITSMAVARRATTWLCPRATRILLSVSHFIFTCFAELISPVARESKGLKMSISPNATWNSQM